MRGKIGDGGIIIEGIEEIITTEEIDVDIVGTTTGGTAAIEIMGDAIVETTEGVTGHARGDVEAIDECVEGETLLISTSFLCFLRIFSSFCENFGKQALIMYV